MSDKDKKRAVRQKKWESEQERYSKIEAYAPQARSVARSRGFDLPFFDCMDSYEAEFLKVAEVARQFYPTLTGIHEVEVEDEALKEREKYGIGADWEHIRFTINDPAADTYNDPDHTGNINGLAAAFWDTHRSLRTVVFIRQSVSITSRSRDAKYAFKLIALFHELGHVDDFEKQVNLRFEGVTDIIEAEVYANLYALERCNQRGLFVSADALEEALRKYLGGNDYRAEVGKRVLERYQRPDRKHWSDYLDEDLSRGELKVFRRAKK